MSPSPSPSPTLVGILAAAVAAAAAPSAGHVNVQGRRLAVLVPPLRNLTAETNGNCGRSACSNERELRRCPQTCGVALDIIDELSSRGRLPRQGTRPARHELIANLQSKVEELTIASGGSRADVPLAVHDALVDVAVSLNDQRAAHGDPRRPGFDQLRAFIYAASSPSIGTAKRSGSDTTARRTLFASVVGPSDAPPSPPLPLEARCASVGCVASSINSAFSAVEQALIDSNITLPAVAERAALLLDTHVGEVCAEAPNPTLALRTACATAQAAIRAWVDDKFHEEVYVAPPGRRGLRDARLPPASTPSRTHLRRLESAPCPDDCVERARVLLPDNLIGHILNQTITAEVLGGYIGYPLTVILSYLLSLDAFLDQPYADGWTPWASGRRRHLDVGGAIPTVRELMARYPVASRKFLELHEVVDRFGYSSEQGRTYYDQYIYLDGEKTIPFFDVGWANKFIAMVEGTWDRLGRHTYRKVPSLGRHSGPDYEFSVSPLEDRPLRIGVLSDWPTGAPQSLHVLHELKKQAPDIVIHLGDTYYSGTRAEQEAFLHDPIKAVLGEAIPVYLVPGNHDYYGGGGEGFYHVLDEFGVQPASYFTLRGAGAQIVAVDTGLLNNQDYSPTMMPFLPDDQIDWALHQIEVGRQAGLKTIFMSHHQFFSRAESVGVANNAFGEALTGPDRIPGPLNVYQTSEYSIGSTELAGGLSNDLPPAANTRLLNQFPPDVREYVSAFYWGHEHSTSIFDRYVNITRGRCIGNSGIAFTTDVDQYAVNGETVSAPFGGPPPLLPKEKGGCARDGCRTGQGNTFWNLGFVTLDIDAGAQPKILAKHWEVQQDQSYDLDALGSVYLNAKVYFEEEY